MEKSWNCVFEFLWEPCHRQLRRFLGARFFHDYLGFFKFHDFSMHGTFFSDFPGFP